MMKGGRKAVALTLLLLLCCGGMLYGWSRFLRGADPPDLQRELAALRAHGVAWDPASLQANATVPDADNAAPLYLSSVARLRTPPASARDDLLRLAAKDLEKGLTPAEEAWAVKCFAKHRTDFERIERASTLPRVDFKRRWELGYAMLLPEYAQLKSLGSIFCLRARLRSRAGNAHGALADLRTAMRIARHAGQEPLFIAQLVRLSMTEPIFLSAQEVVSHHPQTTAQLRTLLADDPAPDFRAAIGPEVWSWRTLAREDASEYLRLMGYRTEDVSARVRLTRFASIRAAMEATHIRDLRKLYEALPRDPEALDQTLEAFASFHQSVATNPSLAGSIVSELLSPFSDPSDALVGFMLRREAARIALDRIEGRTDSVTAPSVRFAGVSATMSGKNRQFRLTLKRRGQEVQWVYLYKRPGKP